MIHRISVSTAAFILASSLSVVSSSAQPKAPAIDPVAQAIHAEQMRQAELNPSSVAAAIFARWDAEVRASGKWNATAAVDLMGALMKLTPENLVLASEATSYKGVMNVIATGRSATPAPGPDDITVPSLAQRLGDSGADLVYTPVTPCRIADTRVAGGVIAATTSRLFDIDGGNLSAQGGSATGCLPYGVVTAAVLTLTVVTPTGPGFLTAYGYNGPVPLAASMVYGPGDVLSNTTVVPDSPGAGGDFNVYSYASTHLVIDVVGYYAAPQATQLDCTQAFSAMTPVAVNVWTNIDVLCPAGRSATGGGVLTSEGTAGFPGVWTISVPASATVWRTWVDNQTGGSRSIQTWAQCCRVPGR